MEQGKSTGVERREKNRIATDARIWTSIGAQTVPIAGFLRERVLNMYVWLSAAAGWQ
jgi:hypothetical protein